LRKGKAHKVQEEGQPFLEENAIGTWLQNTATDCEQKLLNRKQNVTYLRILLTEYERFFAYFTAELDFYSQQKHLHSAKANLEANCNHQETAYQESLAEKQEIEALFVALEQLLDSPKVDWESPETTEFLPRLKPYSEGNVLVENFMGNVRIAA
ncbi:DNA helicase, partial [Microcoleus anatoxicus PTRS2]